MDNGVLGVPMREFFPKEIFVRKRWTKTKAVCSYEDFLYRVKGIDWVSGVGSLSLQYHVFHYIIDELKLSNGVADIGAILRTNDDLSKSPETINVIKSIDFITNRRRIDNASSSRVNALTMLRYLTIFPVVPIAMWTSVYVSDNKRRMKGILDFILDDLLILAKRKNPNHSSEIRLTAESVKDYVFERISSERYTYLDELKFNLSMMKHNLGSEELYESTIKILNKSIKSAYILNRKNYDALLALGSNVIDKERLDLFLFRKSGNNLNQTLIQRAITVNSESTPSTNTSKRKGVLITAATSKKELKPIMLSSHMNVLQKYCNKHSLTLRDFAAKSRISFSRLNRMNKFSDIHLQLPELLKLEKYIGFNDISKDDIAQYLCDVDLCKLVKLSKIFNCSIESITRLDNNHYLKVKGSFYGDAKPFPNDWNELDLEFIRATFCEVDYDGIYQILSNDPKYVKSNTVMAIVLNSEEVKKIVEHVQFVYEPVIESYGYDKTLERVLKGCLGNR